LGWSPVVDERSGLASAYEDFKRRYSQFDKTEQSHRF
jgi:hypothetical protein